mmetsp:Transcript_62314/g.140927  ORF Transcript_62314/g.140927 Transcript_62314/m.140927 type:complete len:206 (+) Transcript_62314:424-1041(+)
MCAMPRLNMEKADPLLAAASKWPTAAATFAAEPVSESPSPGPRRGRPKAAASASKSWASPKCASGSAEALTANSKKRRPSSGSKGRSEGSCLRCAFATLTAASPEPASAASRFMRSTSAASLRLGTPGWPPNLVACRSMQAGLPSSAHSSNHSCPKSSHVAESLYQRIQDQRLVWLARPAGRSMTRTPCSSVLWWTTASPLPRPR